MCPSASKPDFRKRFGKAIDVCRRTECPRANPYCTVRKRTDRAVDVRRTVQPRPHRDVERLVENTADLGRGERFALEAQRADAPGCVTVAVDLVAADLVEPFPEPLAQLDFVAAD